MSAVHALFAQPTSELAARCEATFLRALVAVAAKRQIADVDRLRARLVIAEAAVGDLAETGPIAEVADRLGLTADQRAFWWTAIVLAIEPRLANLVDDLAGPTSRHGLSPATFAELASVEPAALHALVAWLAASNPLVEHGLLVPSDRAAVAMARPYEVPPRVLAFALGEPPGTMLAPIEGPILDDAQQAVLARLYGLLCESPDIVLVVEGAAGSGRRTAVAQAWGKPIAAIDAAGGDLVAVKREAFLCETIPLVANVDALDDNGRAALARWLADTRGPIALTAREGVELPIRRAVVRVRWPVSDVDARRALWRSLAGVTGDVTLLAERHRVGPGPIRRAVASARAFTGPTVTPTATELAHGLVHNITEHLGELATRIEISQRWEDLVLVEDTADQIEALVARVRCASQVLDGWRYRSKLALGAGVAALFSGPPGTGKTMAAGLIARELELDLYRVDLAKVVSKWVGETEKQLARVFDAAEQGHALLLFDEADALFAQRSADVKGANDRYANLEVNYLLQRIESFGGVAILTTNLASAIDPALMRRLAAHVVFDAPETDERTTIWRRNLETGAAPLARDVDGAQLARAFPKMTGANIRNAVLGAAFLAASAGATTIAMHHVVRAARVEYRAMGHVAPEVR